MVSSLILDGHHDTNGAGRRAICQPQSQCRFYANTITNDSRVNRPSTGDHQATRTILGHPDEASSLLDAIGHQSTPATAPLEEAVAASQEQIRSISTQVLSMQAAQNDGAIPVDKTNYYFQSNELPPAPYPSLEAMEVAERRKRDATWHGSNVVEKYDPKTIIYDPPSADELNLETLLANQCHLGHATALWHPGNSSYIFGIRHGIHVISLEITLSYLRRAARVVQEIARRGGMILFVGTKKNTIYRDIVVTSAQRADGYHIFSRWIPGSLTNGQQILEGGAIKIVNGKDVDLGMDQIVNSENKSVLRPDLVIVLNPMENEVCLHECGIYNIPTIGIVDTNVNPAWVTYPVPGNDDSPRSVALISGVLSRAAEEGQRSRKEAAAEGRVTYDTSAAKEYISHARELAGAKDAGRDRGGDDGKPGRRGR